MVCGLQCSRTMKNFMRTAIVVAATTALVSHTASAEEARPTMHVDSDAQKMAGLVWAIAGVGLTAVGMMMFVGPTAMHVEDPLMHPVALTGIGVASVGVVALGVGAGLSIASSSKSAVTTGENVRVELGLGSLSLRF
jgi:hypothetical protein